MSPTQGQTCKTPCELTVPSPKQPVTITKNEYLPQTVQVTLVPQPDHSFWDPPPRAGALEDVSKVLFEIVSMYS
jgi:hypothetical protein